MYVLKVTPMRMCQEAGVDVHNLEKLCKVDAYENGWRISLLAGHECLTEVLNWTMVEEPRGMTEEFRQI